jgi:hypothetical protein
MFKRHCLWQTLRDVIVGRSYSPDFYKFISHKNTRNTWCKIAEETEQDYQHLIALLKSFNVNVIRPNVHDIPDWRMRKTHAAWFKQFGFVNGEKDYPTMDCCLPPPMEPRDWFSMMDTKLIHWLHEDQLPHYQHILDHISAQGNKIFHSDTEINAEGWITKMGKRVTYSQGGACMEPVPKTDFEKFASQFAPQYENLFYDMQGWADGVMRPLRPGLLISLYESPRYEKDFPGWDVIAVTHDSWGKMDKWLKFKRKLSWFAWNRGSDGEFARNKLAQEWIDSGWQEYCSQNVFDVNILSLDEKNIIVFNNIPTIINELEKRGMNVHVSHFRHRYFWGGGIHCVTADINRDGELEDYFS